VDTQPHGERQAILSLRAAIQGAHGLDDAQARVHRAPGVVFMGYRVAKMDQQAIAEALGDMARVGLDDRGRSFLIGTDHRA
jgi:hypothetical protein